MLLAQTYDAGADAAGAGIGLAIILISALFSLALLAFHIYVLVDILRHSDAAWQLAGQSKGLWIALWVITLCCGFSLILDLIYWFAIRSRLVASGQMGPPGYGGGYPS